MKLALPSLGNGCRLQGARAGIFVMISPAQMVFHDTITNAVYVVKGPDSMASYGTPAVKLRKVYSSLTGTPLAKINAAIAKERKGWQEKYRKDAISELRNRAEALGYDIVIKGKIDALQVSPQGH